jgi:high affinity Mn2+ porin
MTGADSTWVAIGTAWGTSNWSTPFNSGSYSLFRGYDSTAESGSWFLGLQAGYNYELPNGLVLGVEADVSTPSWPSLGGISIGCLSDLNATTFGRMSYSETVLDSGTLRGRIGYTPGSWFFYATGGFSWSYDQLSLTQVLSGASASPFLWRLGWTAGGGVEVPFMPHWTARLEYLYTGYGSSSVAFPGVGPTIASNWSQQEMRLGVNYRFNDGTQTSAEKSGGTDWSDSVNFHAQTTFVEQAYPSFRSSFQGANSLPGGGEGRETADATLYVGLKPWQAAEIWVDPEIDQGLGVGDTHGIAGFPSAESYKLGSSYPYGRLQRYFLRQTIDLGGDSEKVDADVNQFAGSHRADRLVLTAGKFSVADIFDTNTYANNPKTDFLNWSAINAGTFDYAGDAWGYTYGAAAEWYKDRWTLRLGLFDLSRTPAGGVSPTAYELDSTFQQFEWVGEIEERHDLWGQPSKLKITGFLERGRMGSYADAIALAQATGGTADINAVRTYTSRPGVSANLEQAVTDVVGVFARAGWADGTKEPFDFTDIDRTAQAGVSFNGKPWDRPDDTAAIVGIVNGISRLHQEFLNDGGLGLLVGDGTLLNYGPEKILEAYYSYALTNTIRLSADYQFMVNPGYNADRGPVNIFAIRLHLQY